MASRPGARCSMRSSSARPTSAASSRATCSIPTAPVPVLTAPAASGPSSSTGSRGYRNISRRLVNEDRQRRDGARAGRQSEHCRHHRSTSPGISTSRRFAPGARARAAWPLPFAVLPDRDHTPDQVSRRFQRRGGGSLNRLGALILEALACETADEHQQIARTLAGGFGGGRRPSPPIPRAGAGCLRSRAPLAQENPSLICRSSPVVRDDQDEPSERLFHRVLLAGCQERRQPAALPERCA